MKHSPLQKQKGYGRFDFVYTSKHGSWLNMEIGLNVLTKQRLNRRIDNIETVAAEVQAWQSCRNGKKAVINWRFTARDDRMKLKRLYPTILDWLNTSLKWR